MRNTKLLIVDIELITNEWIIGWFEQTFAHAPVRQFDYIERTGHLEIALACTLPEKIGGQE
ncbi:hypothetical protein BAG01nite_05770 [Brevibacillus agri]|uniref:Uncharacterized protein n=1 Tax=Brevibacillus agri TaxID=51101 RepID=A0A3M8BBL6_9BACL|nr:hypothetical protein BA6348_15170 [Brevibacillus agri]RNB60861.1 hypothetical protein EB820_01650 [Brevibacillus agri]GED24475.1 hypothetical protein BAG01nite_05770 [Brevibacillus agri]